jgi:hypothetical protein
VDEALGVSKGCCVRGSTKTSSMVQTIGWAPGAVQILESPGAPAARLAPDSLSRTRRRCTSSLDPSGTPSAPRGADEIGLAVIGNGARDNACRPHAWRVGSAFRVEVTLVGCVCQHDDGGNSRHYENSECGDRPLPGISCKGDITRTGSGGNASDAGCSRACWVPRSQPSRHITRRVWIAKWRLKTRPPLVFSSAR